MYLKTLKIWNFRKYGCGVGPFASSEPGITINFHDGLNVLIGENNSGKTAIIDAIRYVLKTQSGEPIYLEAKDFYQDETDRKRATQLKIECIFDGITDENAGKLLEWCSINKETGKYTFKIWLYAKIDNNHVIQYVRAGEDEGKYIEGPARDYLKVVYLKPLRDSLTDMTHGYKSRIAQILSSHTTFRKEKMPDGSYSEHILETRYKELQHNIDKYFESEKGKSLTDMLNDLLKHFLTASSSKDKAAFHLTGNDLNDILRQLDLVLEENKSGLGSLNLLCIAAELLLFKDANHKSIRLTLIEELEAHLHPQYQLRLIDYIENTSDENGQFILTTHSTTVGSQIPLEKLIILKDKRAFPMDPENTELSNGDYKFLQRFLDATKANLFFANGLLMVEGDAENLLIPEIAKIIDRPLNKYGVSIVNVGSTAFKRYVDIFRRKDHQNFGMPVAVVTDLDVPALEYLNEIKKKATKYQKINTPEELSKYRITIRTEKETNFNQTKEIKIFLPLQWTLEYEIASSCLSKCLDEAVKLAPKEDNKSFDFEKEKDNWLNIVKENWKEGERNTNLRYESFKPFLGNNHVSKAIAAQNLASILDSLDSNYHEELAKSIKDDKFLRYLCDAIYHVTEPCERKDE